jgi:hypothetical protein
MNYTISEEILETLLACQTPMEVTMVIDEIKRKNPDKDINWGVEGREGMAKRSQSIRYYIGNVTTYDEYKELNGGYVCEILKRLEAALSNPREE